MNKSKDLDGLNSKYLIALGVSRFTRIAFWVTMSNRLWTFWFLILADTVHTLMVIGFALSYARIRKETKGESVLAMSG